jgi:hypothetical protein
MKEVQAEIARLRKALEQAQTTIDNLTSTTADEPTTSEKGGKQVNREIQYQWDGERGKEFYDKPEVVRLTDSLRRDFSLASARAGLKKSTIMRIMIMKFCDKMNSYPKEMRGEPVREIDSTVETVVDALPMVRRQLQASPRMY